MILGTVIIIIIIIIIIDPTVPASFSRHCYV
jgi:hypothetical protein